MHICPDSASEGVYVARPSVDNSCARLTTNPKYLSYMSLFYPYDVWSRSAELNDLTDDAIRLLMFLRQSTLSPMLLAQGVLLYEKIIIWVAKDAVRFNFCYDRCWLYVTHPLYHRKTWVYCGCIAMLGMTSGHGYGLRTDPSTQSLQSSNSRAGAQLIK